MNARPPTVHDAECMCPQCLMIDMEAHLRAQGKDTSGFWADLPAAFWKGMPAASSAALVAGHRKPGDPDGPGELFTPAPPAAGEPVPVPVCCLHAGAWARFTGTTRDGSRLVLSGAVIGGPDDVDVAGTPMLAVLVRSYRPGDPDRVLYVPVDGLAELVDDPADHEARRAHAVAPVYAPGAVQALRTWRDKRGRWQISEHENVSAEQLAEWESGPEPLLLAVWREHLPIPGGAL